MRCLQRCTQNDRRALSAQQWFKVRVLNLLWIKKRISARNVNSNVNVRPAHLENSLYICTRHSLCSIASQFPCQFTVFLCFTISVPNCNQYFFSFYCSAVAHRNTEIISVVFTGLVLCLLSLLVLFTLFVVPCFFLLFLQFVWEFIWVRGSPRRVSGPPRPFLVCFFILVFFLTGRR